MAGDGLRRPEGEVGVEVEHLVEGLQQVIVVGLQGVCDPLEVRPVALVGLRLEGHQPLVPEVAEGPLVHRGG